MKVNHRLKDIRHHILKIVAISLALLLFLAIGVGTLITTAYAIKPREEIDPITPLPISESTVTTSPLPTTTYSVPTPTPTNSPVPTPTRQPHPTSTSLPKPTMTTVPRPIQTQSTGNSTLPVSSTGAAGQGTLNITATPGHSTTLTIAGGGTAPHAANQQASGTLINTRDMASAKQQDSNILNTIPMPISGISSAALLLAAILIGLEIRRRKRQQLAASMGTQTATTIVHRQIPSMGRMEIESTIVESTALFTGHSSKTSRDLRQIATPGTASATQSNDLLTSPTGLTQIRDTKTITQSQAVQTAAPPQVSSSSASSPTLVDIDDPSLQSLMRQAQIGIFALPDRERSEAIPTGESRKTQ